MNDQKLLQIKNLIIEFKVRKGNILRVIDDVNIDIKRGEVHGLVGESGCGKTVLSLSILRLTPGGIKKGSILWKSLDILKLSETEMLKIRGKEITMIFQNPQSSLNPVYTVKNQLVSVIMLHHKVNKKEAEDKVKELLSLVNITDHNRILGSYPHQLSGGTCQRIMIAMAISCQPELLIADEPTTSLDVTIQAQILDLLVDIRKRYKMTILLVSHDLGVIASMCDSVSAMYLGRIVEHASVKDFFHKPLHPYTQALISSVLVPDPDIRKKKVNIEGIVPTPDIIPSGCSFRTRCPKAFDLCSQIKPMLININDGDHKHFVACLLYNNKERG